MKIIIVAALCVLYAAITWSIPEEKSATMYDDLLENVDDILYNDRLYQSYINCFKTGKGCTPAGQTIRSLVPEMLFTNCSKCSDMQYKQSKYILHFLIDKKPNDIIELANIFDPDHEYRRTHVEKLKNEGYSLLLD